MAGCRAKQRGVALVRFRDDTKKKCLIGMTVALGFGQTSGQLPKELQSPGLHNCLLII